MVFFLPSSYYEVQTITQVPSIAFVTQLKFFCCLNYVRRTLIDEGQLHFKHETPVLFSLIPEFNNWDVSALKICESVHGMNSIPVNVTMFR